MVRLSIYSYEALKEVREAERLDYDQAAKGVLHLYRTQKALDDAARTEIQTEDPRGRPEIVDSAGAVALEPALARSRHLYQGALYFRHDETGDAHKFSTALAAAQGLAVSLSSILFFFDGRARDVTLITAHALRAQAK